MLLYLKESNPNLFGVLKFKVLNCKFAFHEVNPHDSHNIYDDDDQMM